MAISTLTDEQKLEMSAGIRRILPKIAAALKLDEPTTARLLGLANSDYQAWLSGDWELGSEQIERTSLILGIYKALHELLPNHAANRWLHRPNTTYRGAQPIEHLKAGRLEDLYDMRRYLEAEIQIPFS